MEPLNCDHDSFVFKKKINNHKQNVMANKHRSRVNKQRKQPLDAIVPEPAPFVLDLTDLPPVLSKCTIYIHKDLNVARLKTIAEGMGAAVKPDMTQSITHLIIEPKGDGRQLRMVNQAVSKGIICASPKWLMACYSQKTFCPPTAYQYDIDESIHTLDPAPSGIYNPFNTTYIDFDSLEKTRPLEGGQLRMDGFVQRVSVESSPEAISSDQPEEAVQEEEDEDEVEIYSQNPMQEFFYNSSGNTTDNQETEEEMKAKKLKSQERLLQIQKAVEERRAMLKGQVKEEPIPKKKRTASSVYGERLKIWYGEQYPNQETSKRLRR